MARTTAPYLNVSILLCLSALSVIKLEAASAEPAGPTAGDSTSGNAATSTPAPVTRPSFIVILTDDLDATMDTSGPLAMPATNRLLADEGVTFSSHFVSTPICCPSRVNLLKGQFAHNTNFTDVLGPHGGYAKFRALGLDRDWLPGWLQQAGYTTLYTGKFIVDYNIVNCGTPPAGWSVFDALVHPFTFEYYCPAFSLNGGKPRMYPAQYSTDVVRDKALAMLRSAAAAGAGAGGGAPFYLQVAPPAPHHSMHYDYNASGSLRNRQWYPPVPASRHWELFSDARLPRPPSFNDADLDGKPAWMRDLLLLTRGNVTFLEEVFRLRLRAMRAVDELVEALVHELHEMGLANSTYVLFTSDNGYHEGIHRMGSGKTTPFDEDLRVPLLMAGPGLTPGSHVSDTTLHVDLAPTVMALAGLPVPPSVDGTPLPLHLAAQRRDALPDGYPTPAVLRNQWCAEFWGSWDDESIHSHKHYPNNTWRAMRVLRSDKAEAYKYVIHCSGEYELYDLARDPYEQVNLLYDTPSAGQDSRTHGGQPRSWGRLFSGIWSQAKAAVATVAGAATADGAQAADGAGDDTAAGTTRPEQLKQEGSYTHSIKAAVRTAVAQAWAATAWAAAALGPRPSTPSLDESDVDGHTSAHAASVGSTQPAASIHEEQGARSATCRTGAQGTGRSAGGGSRSCKAGANGWLGSGWWAGGAEARRRVAREHAAWVARLRGRLDALAAVLAVCQGHTCTEPFKVLHPEGGVSDLWAAMDPQYDRLYDSIPPFRYGKCLPYQDLDNEVSVFRGVSVHVQGQQEQQQQRQRSVQEPGAGVQGAAAAAASAAGGVTGAAGVGEGGAGQRQQSFVYRQADIEDAATPLPPRYALITDVYGDTAATDAQLLA